MDAREGRRKREREGRGGEVFYTPSQEYRVEKILYLLGNQRLIKGHGCHEGLIVVSTKAGSWEMTD